MKCEDDGAVLGTGLLKLVSEPSPPHPKVRACARCVSVTFDQGSVEKKSQWVATTQCWWEGFDIEGRHIDHKLSSGNHKESNERKVKTALQQWEERKAQANDDQQTRI